MQSWVMSLVTVVVALCAVLAAFGFRGRVSTIGVDLGTTYSVVGVRFGGHVKIIEDESHRVLFPSVVSYLDSGDVIVGYEALARLKSHPEATIFNSKRFIGRNWEDQSIQEYGQNHPYTIARCNTSVSNYSTVAFQVPTKSRDSSDRVFKLVSPEDVGAEILKHLLQITARYLGHNQVNKAVIAVPAKFTSEQRAATGAAYKAAGLKVVRVIEEPTAAAVAYDLHKKSNVHHILVYDFGGGTLDVSLLYVAKGSVQVYATDGDDELGGSDLDMCLYNILTEKVFALTNREVHIPSLSDGHHGDMTELCVPATVRQKSEQVKKDLTTHESANFSCKVPEKDHNNVVQFTLSRSEFEDGCQHLFERSMSPVSRLLDDLGMSRSDVDEIVLVGGTTRIPLVKQQLRDFFERDDLNDKIDPDVTVAHGAASIL
eukprot:CAMPEP_0185035284 /NCGR_PEP_ID=MMETSP1103-20130426/26384_1 /TAXON_ID=36769 /ORGANISM="Paraphysomonas bandaiensis, Strain Caron Lab Isolate" /LENGTH=428 /DNA_ID=CAMNT_0027572295 /DNA_START=45 /DNA_END=1328 /DNA_ORIENTATION=+